MDVYGFGRSRIDARPYAQHVAVMSILEIKAEAERMPEEEVRYLAAYFHHLARRRNPGYANSLDEAFLAIEHGDKVSLDEIQRLDAELRRSGI